MKYFIIAGEASGDLHASHLIHALRAADASAEFVGFGGDLMQAAGLRLLRHYKHTAFMGFVQVLRHLPTILRAMRQCKAALREERPDVLLLVDYPGFNLAMARYAATTLQLPVYYYIAPKMWAWKEGRVAQLKRYVRRTYSILPFEVDFFEKRHNYPVCYVGNPTAEEVAAYRAAHHNDSVEQLYAEGLVGSTRPIIALLPGSRKHEVRDNLPLMYRVAHRYIAEGYQVAISVAPDLSDAFYKGVLAVEGLPPEGAEHVSFLSQASHRLMHLATAALVTSGTATLETALFGTPQVVCYYTPVPALIALLRRLFLKVRYISLVNLIADAPIVPELVADTFCFEQLDTHLRSILPAGEARQAQLDGYALVASRLGEQRAAQTTAMYILKHLAEDSLARP